MQNIHLRENRAPYCLKATGTLLLLIGLMSLIACQGLSSAAHQISQEIGNLTWGSQSLTFGGVSPGSSKTMTVVATNSGTAALNITGASFSTNYFSLLSPALPVTIAPGQNATLSVKFTPNAAGSFSAVATINSNASDAVSNIALSGSGTEPATGTLDVNPTSIPFGNVTVANKQSISVTVKNDGGASDTISQVGVTGTGFSVTGFTSPITLGAGGTGTFIISFDPPTAASESGNLTITSDGSNPTLTVPLSGTGVAASTGQLAVSPSPLAVGNVVVGTSGTASGSLTASGASVTVTAASVSNSAFSVSGLSLPATIPAGQSIPFTVTFSPQSTGSASATLSVTSNAQTTTSTDTLTATGTAAPTHTVSLSWNASTSSDISGYNVYRAPYSGSCGSFSKINPNLNTTTLYTDSVVADGSSYCYATTAVNSSNEESGYSNVVSNVQIPAP
jgi:hypothetical protein